MASNDFFNFINRDNTDDISLQAATNLFFTNDRDNATKDMCLLSQPATTLFYLCQGLIKHLVSNVTPVLYAQQTLYNNNNVKILCT